MTHWPRCSTLVSAGILTCAAGVACSDTGGTSDDPKTIAPTADYSGTTIPPKCQTGAGGSGYSSFTLSGGTTIDGPYALCGLALGSGDTKFSATIAEPAMGGVIHVKLLVPVAQFAGVGAYPCGYETNVFPSASLYCNIEVEHELSSYTDSLIWMLSAGPQPGVRPNCSITLGRLPSQRAAGSFGCEVIPDAGAVMRSTHPDVGKPITITGSFEFIAAF